MGNKKQCLIITATIDPNSNFVSQSNLKERRNEYLEALKYYVNIFKGDIYFAENSNYDFEEDKEFKVLFELNHVFSLAFSKSPEIEKGKGYQEFAVLDAIVLKLEKQYDEFIKVSGRYVTANFEKLIQQTNKGIIIDRHQKKKIAITSFFRCKMNFYQSHLTSCYQKVNDGKGVFIEHIVYDKLNNLDINLMNLFFENPIYKGVSGSYGGDLNRHHLKMKIRNIERKFLKLMKIKKFIVEY